MGTEYSEWIKKAEQDLDTSNYNLDGGRLEAAAFFLQQAAEKALKALHIKQLGSFPKIHDLVSLARNVKAPEKIILAARLLSPAYQYTRYPDVGSISELEEEIVELKNACVEILKWTKRNL